MASTKLAEQPAKAERPMRVVLYQQQLASANGLRDLLVRRGFEVRTAGVYNDLAGWLMLYGESTVLVLELPAIEMFRRAVLKEVRRVAPGIGVVALAKAVTPEVQRDAEAARVARVLPTDATPDEIATAVKLAREDIRAGIPAEREPVLEDELE